MITTTTTEPNFPALALRLVYGWQHLEAMRGQTAASKAASNSLDGMCEAVAALGFAMTHSHVRITLAETMHQAPEQPPIDVTSTKAMQAYRDWLSYRAEELVIRMGWTS